MGPSRPLRRPRRPPHRLDKGLAPTRGVQEVARTRIPSGCPAAERCGGSCPALWPSLRFPSQPVSSGCDRDPARHQFKQWLCTYFELTRGGSLLHTVGRVCVRWLEEVKRLRWRSANPMALLFPLPLRSRATPDRLATTQCPCAKDPCMDSTRAGAVTNAVRSLAIIGRCRVLDLLLFDRRRGTCARPARALLEGASRLRLQSAVVVTQPR